MSLREVLFGRPIADQDAAEERIGSVRGIPVLGLDALASATYGPEAALTALLVLGGAGLRFLSPILAVIGGILLLVYLSYRQTIEAYPNGGGSYTVAHENLGDLAGMVAAAALCLDYLLNVAVAISSGVGALVSALPPLLPLTLPLCLALLLLLTLINLRGVKSAGAALVVPTYAFVGCLLVTMAIGLVKTVAAGGHPAPVVRPPPIPRAVEAASAWIVLRAFANGCTAMTGVEAVSNAVPLFREPRARTGQRTLGIIIGVLTILLAGVALLTRAYGIVATAPGKPGYQSVMSMIVAAVAGRGVFYYVTLASIVIVLCLSANTSFAGFPRVCRVLALDRHLPPAFAHAGRRLVYSTGIIILAVLSALLLVAFRGIADNLIPLFAIGALTAFTMSQAGMVVHWWRRRSARSRWAMALNGTGALATGATLGFVAVSKFTEGAWLTVIFVPLVVFLLARTRAHYRRISRETCMAGPLELAGAAAPVVVVPLKALDRVTRKALRFGLSISADVRAVQVLSGDDRASLRSGWPELVEKPARAAGVPAPCLVTLRSSYRQVTDPLIDYLHELGRSEPGRFIAVLVPELVEHRWYHFLLHSHTATALKASLLFRGGPRVVVISAPWYADEHEAAPRAQPRRDHFRTVR
jgi:amino acid transporter